MLQTFISEWPLAYPHLSDNLTLKVENESESQSRSPIVISLPGRTLFGLDLGRAQPTISLTGIVDSYITELIVWQPTSNFTPGNYLLGFSGIGDYSTETINPTRTYRPRGQIKSFQMIDSNYARIMLDVTSIDSGYGDYHKFFFVHSEAVGEYEDEACTSYTGRSALVSLPFVTLYRLKQASVYWYTSGKLYLTTLSGTYYGYPKNIQYSADAGREDRYSFKLDFAVTTQDV